MAFFRGHMVQASIMARFLNSPWRNNHQHHPELIVLSGAFSLFREVSWRI